MRVLVIGGGGREHALAWKIVQSPLVKKVYCAPGNAGTRSVAENVNISADRIDDLMQFALTNGVGLTEEYYGIVLRKTDPDLLNKINTALEQLLEDGTVSRLHAKWELGKAAQVPALD